MGQRPILTFTEKSSIIILQIIYNTNYTTLDLAKNSEINMSGTVVNNQEFRNSEFIKYTSLL